MKRSAKQYSEALYQLISDQPSQCAQYVKTLNTALRRTKQKNLWPLIIEALEEINNSEARAKTVLIESAKPLTDTQKAEISEGIRKQFPNRENIVLKSAVRPELIGGLRIRIGDRVIDHTVSTKLDQLVAKL